MKVLPNQTRNKKQNNNYSKEDINSKSNNKSPKKDKNYLYYKIDETYGQIKNKLNYYNIQLNTELVNNQNYRKRHLKQIRKIIQSNTKDNNTSIKNPSPYSNNLNRIKIEFDYNYKIQTNISKYFKKNILLLNKENPEIESHLDALWKKLGVNENYINKFNSYKNMLNTLEDKKIFMLSEIENLEKFRDILNNLSKEIDMRENKLIELKSLFDKINNENEISNIKNILTESYSNIISYIENSIRVVEYYLLFKETINKGNTKNIKFNEELIKKIFNISKYGINYLLKMKTDTNFINIKKINEFNLNTGILNSFKADPFLTCLEGIIQIPFETKEKIKYCQYYIIQEDIYESLNKKIGGTIPNSDRKKVQTHIAIDAGASKEKPKNVEENNNINDNLNISYFSGNIKEFLTIYSEYFEKIPEEQKIIFNLNKDPMKYFEHNYYPKIIICKDKTTNIIKGLCIYSVLFKTHEQKPNEIRIEHISSYNQEEMENILTRLLEFIKDNNVLKNISKAGNKINSEIFINLYYKFINEKFQINDNIKDFFKKKLKFKWVKLENISKVIRFVEMKLTIENDNNNDNREGNYNLFSNFSITDNFNINLVEKAIMNNNEFNIKKTNPSNIIYIINLMKKIFNIKNGFEYLLNKLNKFSTKKDLLIESTNNDRAMSLVLNDNFNDDLNINSFLNDIQSISKSITGNTNNELDISNNINIFPLFDGCMSVKYKNYFYNRIECKKIKVFNELITQQRFYLLNTVNNENITILISSNLNDNFKINYLSNIRQNESFNIIDNFEEIFKNLKEFNPDEKGNNNYIYIPAFSIKQKYEQKNVENPQGLEKNVINSFNGDYKIEFLTEELIAKRNKKNNYNFEFDISEEELKNENLIDDEFVIIILDSNIIDKIGIIPAISIYVHKNNFISDSI